jgi:thymidylate synthase ThyX
METRVTLVSWTNDPLETVYSVWEASKSEGKFRTPIEIKKQVNPKEVEKLFRAVIAQNIPVGEHIDFVFMLEGVSVSWREQAVRHRIGTLPSPERVGVDIVMDVIPDLANSSWWSQSMRIQNMGRFAQDMMYRIPETLKNKVVPVGKGEHGEFSGMRAADVYDITMQRIENAYNALVASGVPMEDAREAIPLGAQHRISWKLNIGSLRHIVGERGCWILQLGIWGPVIQGMINELATKVHPIFREFITPPCIKGDSFFEGCVYMEECRRRLDGSDKLPPCPLHLNYHHYDGSMSKSIEGIPMVDEMRARALQYGNFWGRDPYTGKKLFQLGE